MNGSASASTNGPQPAIRRNVDNVGSAELNARITVGNLSMKKINEYFRSWKTSWKAREELQVNSRHDSPRNKDSSSSANSRLRLSTWRIRGKFLCLIEIKLEEKFIMELV